MRAPFLLTAIILVAAACEGGGSGDRQARPDEMRVQIIAGREITHQVRSASAASDVALQGGLVPEPVIVKLSVVTAGAALSAGEGPAGPSAAVTVPPGVLVNFAVSGGPECTNDLLWTPSVITERADTAVNFWRQHTAAVTCWMKATAVKDGQPIGSDSASITYTPGPVATWAVAPYTWLHPGATLDLGALVTNARDVHGNLVTSPTINAAVTGAGLSLSGLSVSASEEETGVATLTSGTATAAVTVHAVRNLNAHEWRITWGCFGKADASGWMDSATFQLEVDSVEYVEPREDGVRISFRGQRDYRSYYNGSINAELSQGFGELPGRLTAGVIRMGGGSPGERMTDAGADGAGYLGSNFCAPGTAGWRALRIERL